MVQILFINEAQRLYLGYHGRKAEMTSAAELGCRRHCSMRCMQCMQQAGLAGAGHDARAQSQHAHIIR